MKIAVLVSLIASATHAVHGMAINYQPNNAVSSILEAPAIASAQTPGTTHNALSKLAQANTVERNTSKAADKPDEDTDPSATLLAQLLTPLQTVLTRLLKGAEVKLEHTDAKTLANALRGPVGDLKTYLISIWPDTPPLAPAH